MSGLVEAGTAATRPEPRRTSHARTWRRLLRQPAAVAAGGVLAAVLVIGAIAPRITPDPQTINLSEHWRNQAPMLSGWHLLGTDNLGRDLLVRTLSGLHTSER